MRAAIAASATGAALGIHALDESALRGALAVVESDRLDLRQVIWGHAEFSSSKDHLAAVDKGMTLQFDGMAVSRPAPYALDNPEQRLLEQVEHLVERGFTEQILISNDASINRLPDAAYAGDPGVLIRDFAPLLAKRFGTMSRTASSNTTLSGSSATALAHEVVDLFRLRFTKDAKKLASRDRLTHRVDDS